MLTRAAAAGLVIAGFTVALGHAKARAGSRGPGAAPARGTSPWEGFSPERLAALRASRIPVFIDFTADWCLTCQVNERIAFGSGEVFERFRRQGVVAMKADWTLQDPGVTEALASHGRQGVPLYVLFGRDPSRAPRVLPEIITPGIVLAALDAELGARATPSEGGTAR